MSMYVVKNAKEIIVKLKLKKALDFLIMSIIDSLIFILLNASKLVLVQFRFLNLKLLIQELMIAKNTNVKKNAQTVMLIAIRRLDMKACIQLQLTEIRKNAFISPKLRLLSTKIWPKDHRKKPQENSKQEKLLILNSAI
ncbi:unnamed protein product [Blepharisma stoltei]|uniref:Transmembrane protein n=1 Tax=Blepharisma stoltei TaxID=1481888 RepID=A0AAU9KMG8_9CILI|nr:unnamed protein product [Blepharisma stoltei]